jgi:hypothetical protein
MDSCLVQGGHLCLEYRYFILSLTEVLQKLIQTALTFNYLFDMNSMF